MLCAYSKITGKYIDNEESSVIRKNWKYLNDFSVDLRDVDIGQEPHLKKIVEGNLVYDNDKIAAITKPAPFDGVKEAAKLSDLNGVLSFLKNIYKGD